MLAEMSSFRAPWFRRGWISDFANTPQRLAMGYTFSACMESSSISDTEMFRSVAIWSMNAPVPPAQLPFMRCSVPPVIKMIFASSPPSSTAASAS